MHLSRLLYVHGAPLPLSDGRCDAAGHLQELGVGRASARRAVSQSMG